MAYKKRGRSMRSGGLLETAYRYARRNEWYFTWHDSDVKRTSHIYLFVRTNCFLFLLAGAACGNEPRPWWRHVVARASGRGLVNDASRPWGKRQGSRCQASGLWYYHDLLLSITNYLRTHPDYRHQESKSALSLQDAGHINHPPTMCPGANGPP